MTGYREVLRLRSLGINHSKIAESMAISRPTVIMVLQRAGLDWRRAEGLSDKELAFRLFPQGEGAPVYTMSDYDWVHREMSKPGVTLQLLWMEYSDRELNEVIRERLHLFNHKPFQKKDGSRAMAFAQECGCLPPLPAQTFELAAWKVATVQYNYHVAADGQFYSVPFDYIKRKVDVRLTRGAVEVFYDGSRICSHVRLYGHLGQYSTLRPAPATRPSSSS